MRILLAMQSPDYLRFYDATVSELVARGHSVDLAVSRLPEDKVQLSDYATDDGRVRALGRLPKRKDYWSTWVRGVRGTMDFVRYLHPEYRDAPLLRSRMKFKVLPRWLRFLDAVPSLPRGAVRALLRILAGLEQAAPVDPSHLRFLAKHRPDLILVTPLIDAGSPQVDLVRAAQAAGIRVAACIASWDNLTNKGLLRVVPDAVLVWNEQQRSEAVEFHGVDAERVHVTGAQSFDRWFGRAPSQDRAEFCRLVGLPDERPFVVFAGSSSFISKWGDDVSIVRAWIRALRESDDPDVRDVGVIVRPHPYYCGHWSEEDLSDLDAHVWPRSYTTITAPDNRRNYFDTLHHTAALVGINTSAMVEAAILGKPVHSIRVPDYSGTQDGTLHFRYLLPENGGFLWVSDDLDQHVANLGRTLRGDYDVERTQRFVGSFLRPHGVARPCVPIVADVVEELLSAGPTTARRRSGGARLLGLVAAPLAALCKAIEARAKGKPVLRSLGWAR